MTLDWYVRKIKRQLGASSLLELEFTDDELGEFVLDALDEIQRYIDIPVLVEVPFSSCIDLKGFKCSSVLNIYRVDGLVGDGTGYDGSTVDPMYAQKWMAFSSSGTSYNLNDWLANYGAFNTLNQLTNTTSTPLAFKEDVLGKKLYINNNGNTSTRITIEYIPIYENVEQIEDSYWVNNLFKMALAMVKIALGRARTRFQLTNALHKDDGELILAEGNQELATLRETLRVNDMQFIPVD